MKTMRYRIRVIALVLVCAVLAVVLWTAKEAWFPAAGLPEETPAETPAETPVESAASLPPDPWAEPTPSPSGEPAASPAGTEIPAGETPSSSPLFDTFGL